MNVFIVDTNFFIQAHRIYYPLDVVPSFWEKVKQLAIDGKMISIDKVCDEIYRNDDALKDWCSENLPDHFFKSTDSIIAQYSQVAVWTASRSAHYSSAALSEFLEASEADAWLVSYALQDNNTFIVVTHEVSQPNRRNKIKIPEVCLPFNVKHVNTIEMFRQIGLRF